VCTIPPAIPDTALPDLILKRDLDAETAIRRYVEWQGKEEVHPRRAHQHRVRASRVFVAPESTPGIATDATGAGLVVVVERP
jgi:hypothetical protein